MLFKRCSRCGGRVAADACPRCDRSAVTWTYVLDTSPSGLVRHQRKRGGFATKREAAEALAHCLAAIRAGLPPEGDDVTVGQFLNEWLAGVTLGGSIRPTTAKAYEVAIRVHIVPSVGSLPLRLLNRAVIRATYVDLSAHAALPDRGDEDLVFPRPDGQPRDPDAVSHRFSDLVRRHGLPKIRLHDLRHTHATLALQAAINPKVVQERLGHASVKVTLDTYTHVLPPLHREAATRIAALVDLPRSDAPVAP